MYDGSRVDVYGAIFCDNCAFDATRCLFANQAFSEVVFANMVVWYNKYEGEDKKEIEKLI